MAVTSTSAGRRRWLSAKLPEHARPLGEVDGLGQHAARVEPLAAELPAAASRPRDAAPALACETTTFSPSSRLS